MTVEHEPSPNDPVYRERQLHGARGADPFEDADRPESDPAASAAGEGRRHLDEALPEVRRMLAEKRELDRRVRGVGR